MPATTSKQARDLTAFGTFDTAIGRCALIWRGGFVVGASLPRSDAEALRQSVATRFPGAVESAPPPYAALAIDAIKAGMAGQEADLSHVPVDLGDLSHFDRLVLIETRNIRRGETRTYGEIAARLGAGGAARAVGRALGANPIPIIIPCHRVIAANGGSGGFSADGGAAVKMRILGIERATRGDAPLLFDDLAWQIKT